MTKRINISIPEDLHAELDNWRDQLNVSGICQEALEKEVGRLKAVATAGEDLDSVVKRLRAEKDEWERQWYERGIQLGREWAKQARYQRLLAWQGRNQPPPDDLLDLLVAPVAGTGWRKFGISLHERERLVDAYPTLDHILLEYEPGRGVRIREYNAGRLTAGWLKGVRDFWNEVEDAL